MNKGKYLLLIALGAAIVSAVIILVSHYFIPKPPWAYANPTQGWTIYPPLSALPQAIPHREGPTFEEYISYMGLLMGASIAASVALLLWLLGGLAARFNPGEQRLALRIKVVPILLLMPCVVHVVGMIHYFRQEPYAPEQLLQDFPPLQENLRQLDGFRNDSSVAPALDSLDDAMN